MPKMTVTAHPDPPEEALITGICSKCWDALTGIVIEVACPQCGGGTLVEIEGPDALDRYVSYTDGSAPHIQKHFPELSADQREALITGICSKCWDALTGPEEGL